MATLVWPELSIHPESLFEKQGSPGRNAHEMCQAEKATFQAIRPVTSPLQVIEVCQARGKLLLLVGDNGFGWLFALERGAPVAYGPRVGLDEAQYSR